MPPGYPSPLVAPLGDLPSFGICGGVRLLCITPETVDSRSTTRTIAEISDGSAGVNLSLPIEILKVLASYTDSRAALDAIKSDLATRILITYRHHMWNAAILAFACTSGALPG
jgi:hypothetical protein